MADEDQAQEAEVVAPEEEQPETQETVTEQVEPEGEPEKPKPKLKGVGKRLHQLTTERDYWRQMAQQGAKEPQEPAAPEPVKGLKDFEYDEAKYFAYVSERAKAEAVEAARTEASAWRGEQEAKARRESFESNLAEFADDHPDFYDGWSETPVSQPMADAIMDSEIGPQVAYYLKNNQDVALKLFQLSGAAAAKEIGRIEERLVTEQAKAKEKPVSQAPSPTPKIEGSDPGNVERDPSKMTNAEFRKWRERTIARRSGFR